MSWIIWGSVVKNKQVTKKWKKKKSNQHFFSPKLAMSNTVQKKQISCILVLKTILWKSLDRLKDILRCKKKRKKERKESRWISVMQRLKPKLYNLTALLISHQVLCVRHAQNSAHPTFREHNFFFFFYVNVFLRHSWVLLKSLLM